MQELAREWSDKTKVELKIESADAHRRDASLNDEVCRKLHNANITEGDKLAVISGGSTNTSNFSKNEYFGSGFIDVLDGLNEFLQEHPYINPFVALRSSWFNKNTEVTEKTKAFTQDSLKQLLRGLPNVIRRQNNYEEYWDATIKAVEQAPNEIFTITKEDALKTENEKAFFAFLDKAFLA
jgi:hypothetical protein